MTNITTLRPGLHSQSEIAQSAPEHGLCRGGIRMNTTIGCPIPGASQPKEPARLIDIKEILQYDGAHFTWSGGKNCLTEQKAAYARGYDAGIKFIVEEAKKAPIIDPESMRPTAHWIKRGYVCGENEYECSACHEIEWRTSARRMKYCMFCGSRMSKEIEYR